MDRRLYPRESDARWLFRPAHGTWHVISPADEEVTGCGMQVLSHWQELPLPEDMRALFDDMNLVEVGRVCLACARVAGLYTG